MSTLSIVIPCKNEQESIGSLIEGIIELNIANEIIVVNDGSDDKTAEILSSLDVEVITHPYSKGNGASIKAGARKSTGEILLFLDADGQHDIADISKLMLEIENGFDMVIGARDDSAQASTTRLVGNKIYNKLASLITGHKIEDLTSGFRAVRRELFLEFISLLPNGFSYPTTITMAFLKSGHSVKYVPVNVKQRIGKGHLSIYKDGIRFLLIIFKVGTLYSPLKLFAPLASLIFSSGLGYYLYTFITAGRFTNMSMLLLTISVFIFIFGLISEQITMLIYLNIKDKDS